MNSKNSNTRKKQIKEYQKKNSLVKSSNFSFKKIIYTAIPIVGLIGSTTVVVDNAIVQNNLQTSQTIAQINQNINDNNSSSSSNSNNSSSTTQIRPISASNTNSSANPDQNFAIFLNSLKNNFPNYPNIDYSRTFSKLNTGSNENVNITNNNLTNNSLLSTKKDETEKNSNENLKSSLNTIMLNYRSSWYNNLYSLIESSENENSLQSKYDKDFDISSIIPIAQYCWIDWYKNANDHYAASSFNLDNIKENTDPNNNEIGNFTSGYGLAWLPYHNGQNYYTSNNYYYSNASYGSTTTPPSKLYWSYANQNLIGTSEATNGFTYIIDPFYDTYDVSNYGNFWKTTEISAPAFAGEAGYTSGEYSYKLEEQVNPIAGSDVSSDNSTTFSFPSNILSSTPDSITTLKTFPNNSFFGGWRDFSPNYYYDYYRGLFEWTLKKLPIYNLDENTYQFEVSNNNGGYDYAVNTDGTINTNSELFLNNPNLASQNYYYIKGQGDQKVLSDWSNYYQKRSEDEQAVLDLYKNDQIQNIMQQLTEDKNNFVISNISDVKSTDESIFGTSTNTPFIITKITLPTTFNTNYGDFDVAYNDFDVNASNENGTHTSYLFNNFLPVLSSQIVVDPQSAESSYTDSSNSTGIYSQANGLKFKLSENLSQLLNIADLYNTYETQVNAINPDNYQKNYPQLSINLTTFKNLFETFSFTNDNSSDINTLLNDLNKGTSDSYNDANSLLTTLNSDYATYQSNRNNVLSLIGKVFNMADTSTLKDNSSSAQFIGLTPDAKETLILLPSAVKQALSNDIDADISYGGTTETLPIWSASTQSFNSLNFDLTKTSNDLLADDEAEVTISNIRFTDSNSATTDALTDNLNFINNNVNQNLSYTLSEFNNYYPNNNAITTNGDSLVYKIKYNPDFANWTASSSQIAGQGIAITSSNDTTGYDASDYTNSTSITTKQNNINEAIRDFFNSVTTPTIDPTKIAIVTNENNNIGFVGASYSGYVTAIEQIVNSNNLDLDPNDDTGNFYALVTIDNSQNFLNPEGDSNETVIDGTVWYVGQNQSNHESRTYLVKMNAAKKNYDLSNVGFNYDTTDKSKITWEINNNLTDDYYYNEGAYYSTVNVDANGNALQNQSIVINNTKYVNFINDVDLTDTTSSTYQNLRTSLMQWFSQFYNKSVHSYTVVDNGDETYTINVVLSS